MESVLQENATGEYIHVKDTVSNKADVETETLQQAAEVTGQAVEQVDSSSTGFCGFWNCCAGPPPTDQEGKNTRHDATRSSLSMQYLQVIRILIYISYNT